MIKLVLIVLLSILGISSAIFAGGYGYGLGGLALARSDRIQTPFNYAYTTSEVGPGFYKHASQSADHSFQFPVGVGIGGYGGYGGIGGYGGFGFGR